MKKLSVLLVALVALFVWAAPSFAADEATKTDETKQASTAAVHKAKKAEKKAKKAEKKAKKNVKEAKKDVKEAKKEEKTEKTGN